MIRQPYRQIFAVGQSRMMSGNGIGGQFGHYAIPGGRLITGQPAQLHRSRRRVIYSAQVIPQA